MFKAVCLIRRKNSMTLAQFIERYESGHAVLCARMIPHLVKYVRRYVQTADTVRYEGAPELDFDVVTELWFENRDRYELAMAELNQPDVAARLSADEHELFDLTSIRRFVVDERESVLER